MLNLNNLFVDSEVSFDGTADTTGLSDYTTLDFVSGESHIYGEIMWPGKEFPSERPCVIMLHGFPGSARNDDISHALCRIGCVVIVPHHRGAWGSGGKYLITNCIEDAKNLAQFARTDNFVRKYKINPDKIFLLGHSMGANSALNAGKQLDWLRGIIMLAPYDPTRYLSGEKEVFFHSLLQEGKILNSDGIDSIYEDVVKNAENLSFPNAVSKIEGKNLLLIAADYDSVAPKEDMVYPLWNALQKRNGFNKNKIHRLLEFPAEHGLLGRRISSIREIASFIAACVGDEK